MNWNHCSYQFSLNLQPNNEIHIEKYDPEKKELIISYLFQKQSLSIKQHGKMSYKNNGIPYNHALHSTSINHAVHYELLHFFEKKKKKSVGKNI